MKTQTRWKREPRPGEKKKSEVHCKRSKPRGVLTNRTLQGREGGIPGIGGLSYRGCEGSWKRGGGDSFGAVEKKGWGKKRARRLIHEPKKTKVFPKIGGRQLLGPRGIPHRGKGGPAANRRRPKFTSRGEKEESMLKPQPGGDMQRGKELVGVHRPRKGHSQLPGVTRLGQMTSSTHRMYAYILLSEKPSVRSFTSGEA